MSSMPPIPAAPAWSEAITFGVALACAAVGVAILLWGRKLSRAFLCLTAVGLAWPVWRMLTARFDVDTWVVATAVAVIFAVAALLLARVVWGLLAGVLGAVAAAWALLALAGGGAGAESATVTSTAEAGSLVDWVVGAAGATRDALAGLWGANPVLVLAVIGPAAVGPLVLFIVCPRPARIIMTSLLGGAALVAGPMLAAARVFPTSWNRAWTLWYVPLALAGVLAAFGLAYQFRSAAEADRAAKEQAEEQEQDESPAPTRADRKKTRK